MAEPARETVGSAIKRYCASAGETWPTSTPKTVGSALKIFVEFEQCTSEYEAFRRIGTQPPSPEVHEEFERMAGIFNASTAGIKRDLIKSALDAIPDLELLRALCDANGVKWSETGLRQIRGKLIVDKGLSPEAVDKMPLGEFCKALGTEPPLSEFERLQKKVATIYKRTNPKKTAKVKLREQRLKFIKPRRDEGMKWPDIAREYFEKYPEDPWKDKQDKPGAVRLWYTRITRPTKPTKPTN